jgi:glucosamine--fructose-6-phosphate aminotransferase (isomerizing)
MCGIIAFLGYVYGIKHAHEGLIILQNRGYDSAGICSITDKNNFIITKFASIDQQNAFKRIEESLGQHKESMNIIGHSRWATTGVVSDNNSHPHIDYTNTFSLVHNGIIENYEQLKEELKSKGIPFKSETDTEVIVNLMGYYHDVEKLSPKKSIEKTIYQLEGTWGLVIQCNKTPSKLFCARHGSPLLIGIGDEFMMVASEQSGFSRYATQYIALNNHDIIELTKENNKVTFGPINEYELRKVTAEKCALTPDPYPHWTLKEINEQPQAVIRSMGMGGRILNNKNVKLGGLQPHLNDLLTIDNLIILGCGTSYHAGAYCINVFKKMSGFNTVQLFDGSEFNQYDIPKIGKTGLILLSQSGETKDLHRCIDVGKENNLMMIGVINVVDSIIARDVHCGVYLNAGKEVGVASTKAFTCQVVVLHLIAIWFAQIRDINEFIRLEYIRALKSLPFDIEKTIKETEELCIDIAEKLLPHNSIFMLGKGQNEAIAKEGALKIKEIGYVNANGCNTSSLKHGPYALIEKGFPIVLLIPDDNMFCRNNCVGDELLSREAFVITISDKQLSKYNYNMKIPKNSPLFGLLANVSLQLIAYHFAVKKETQIDTPKNLAKSVTTD